MGRNFTGTDKISLGDVLDQSTFTDCTIAIWFRVNAFNKSWQTIFSKGDNSWRLSRNNATNESLATNGLFPNQSEVSPADNVNDGNWHHGCFSWDNSATLLEYFLDGVSKGTDNTNDSAVDNSYDTLIGENAQQSNRGFDGDLCEFVFFDKLLTLNQVLSLYHGVFPGAIAPENLLAYLPLFGSFATEPDFSGTGKTGTVTGTTKGIHAPVELLENSL